MNSESFKMNLTAEGYELVTYIPSEFDEKIDVEVPWHIGKLPVIAIKEDAFSNVGNLNMVRLPSNIINCKLNVDLKKVKLAYYESPYDGFEHEGMWINNPFYEETGRFEVNPYEYYPQIAGIVKSTYSLII